MQLLRVLLVDGNDADRCRMKTMLDARQAECWEATDMTTASWPLSRKGIDLVVAEMGVAAGQGGPSLDELLRAGNYRHPLPVILYVDPFQPSAAQQVSRAPRGAILIPAPVIEADLDAALDRAFAPWGQSAN